MTLLECWSAAVGIVAGALAFVVGVVLFGIFYNEGLASAEGLPNV